MRNFIKLTAFAVVCFTVLVVVGILAACGPKTEPVEVDYVVPSDVDVVQMCEYVDSGRRSSDVDCDNGREGFRWMYDKRSGHPELPAVGERIYRSEVTWDRPVGDVKIDRIPERGGWWTRQ